MFSGPLLNNVQPRKPIQLSPFMSILGMNDVAAQHNISSDSLQVKEYRLASLQGIFAFHNY